MSHNPEIGVNPNETEERPEIIPDAYSLLSREELEELRDLNIKNTVDGLSQEELGRKVDLEAKKNGDKLTPLSAEEYEIMLEIQRNQASSENWDGEKAKKLWLLELRHEKKGVVDQTDQAEEKVAA
jgi:hypothetical protein